MAGIEKRHGQRNFGLPTVPPERASASFVRCTVCASHVSGTSVRTILWVFDVSAKATQEATVLIALRWKYHDRTWQCAYTSIATP